MDIDEPAGSRATDTEQGRTLVNTASSCKSKMSTIGLAASKAACRPCLHVDSDICI